MFYSNMMVIDHKHLSPLVLMDNPKVGGSDPENPLSLSSFAHRGLLHTVTSSF